MRPLPTDVKNELWVLAARVPKHIGHGLLDIQLRVGPKRLDHRPDGLRIYLYNATQALTCGTPDIRVMVLGPPARGLKDRDWMELTDLDQRRGSHFARLLSVARCQPRELWEDGIRFDAASGKKLLDVERARFHHRFVPRRNYAPHFPTITPMIRPPIVPRIRIGA